MKCKLLILIGVIMILQLVSPISAESYGYNNPTLPTLTTPTISGNGSNLNVNHSLTSDYATTSGNANNLDGYDSSYFYPYSNPSSFYNSSTLPATDLSNYYTKNETITNFSRVQYPYEENLVLYYSFDNLCKDKIQKNRTCVQRRAGYENGLWDGGINGISMNVTKNSWNVSNDNLPTGYSARTLCQWLKWDGVTTHYGFTYGTNGVGTLFFQTIGLEGASYRFGCAMGSSRYYASDTIISANQWYHTCSVIPTGATSTSEIQLYVNGVLNNKTLSSGTSAQTLNTINNDYAMIGGAITGLTLNGSGLVDEIMLWNRNLSATEIYGVYMSSKPATQIPSDVTYDGTVNHNGIVNFFNDIYQLANYYYGYVFYGQVIFMNEVYTDYLYGYTTSVVYVFSDLVFQSNWKIKMGSDASVSTIYNDGNDLVINPAEVGTGKFKILGNTNAFGTINMTSGGVNTNGFARTSTPINLTGSPYFDLYGSSVARLGVQSNQPYLYILDIDGANNSKLATIYANAGNLDINIHNENGIVNKTPIRINMSTGKVTLSDGIDVTGNTNITGNLIVGGNVSMKRPYGMFSSTEDQTIASINTAYPVTFNWTEDNYLITKEGNSNFSVSQSGDYLIELSAVLQSGVANKKSHLWVQKTNSTGQFVNVPRSNTETTIRTINSDYIISVPFILDITTTEKFRIMFAGDDTSVFLNYMTNTSFSPETPSIIMTASKISETTP